MISEEEKNRIKELFEKYENSAGKDKKEEEDYKIKEFNQVYEEEIFPKVFENFEVGKQRDILVLTVGLSYEPIVLSIKYHQPKKIVLIGTDKSLRKCRNKIIDYMKKINLDYYEIVDEKIIQLEDTSKEIFKIIKEVYERNNKDPTKIIVDITGGTKEMPAAVAIATFYLKIPCCYISSDYSEFLRKPKPFTENVKEFNSLLDNYIELTTKEFVNKINNYKFTEAKNIIEEIKERAENSSSIYVSCYEDLINLAKFFIDLINENNIENISNKFVMKGIVSIQISDEIKIKHCKISNLLLKNLIEIKRSKDKASDNKEFLAKKYYFYIIKDLISVMNIKNSGNLPLAYIQLNSILEHIKNYKIKELGKDPDNFDWSGINIEKFKELYKKFLNEDYSRKGMPNKIHLIDGIFIIKTLESESLTDNDLKNIVEHSQKRNILIHSSIEKKQNVNLEEKEINKKIEFVLNLANSILKPTDKIEFKDFNQILTF